VDGAPVDLTRVEFDLLAALARHPGAAVSRGWLVDHVLDPRRDGGERTLDAHVSRLRRKLGGAGRMVATVWIRGFGSVRKRTSCGRRSRCRATPRATVRLA
jgi:DNA-binding response OmpR family regulator